MTATRIPLATQSSVSRSAPLSSQRLVNLFAETQPPDAKARVALFGAPGLIPYASLGAGPVRGMHEMGGRLYVVAGSKLHRVAPGGAATTLGGVAGSGPVTMADSGTQLVIVAEPNAYVWDGEAFAQITDPDFPSAAWVDWLDGYHVFGQPMSGQFFISSLYGATDYDALDFATAESAPDDTVRGIVSNRELWLFGSRSIEVWQNTGAADFPFQRSSVTMDRGCAAAASICRLDGGLWWLGDDGLVYRSNGYQPLRVSTHAIEHAISQWDAPGAAEGWGYTQEGHAFYVLSCGGQTLVYDASTQLWHERQSGLSPARWRASCYAYAHGKALVGDALTGSVYEPSLDAATEAGAPIRREATSAPMHADGKWMAFASVELEVEVGVGLTTGQGSDPQAMLQWSDDGGVTWSSERWTSIGPRGQYRRRARWLRCGRSRNRVWRVAITDPVPVTITGLIVDAEVGSA